MIVFQLTVTFTTAWCGSFGVKEGRGIPCVDISGDLYINRSCKHLFLNTSQNPKIWFPLSRSIFQGLQEVFPEVENCII